MQFVFKGVPGESHASMNMYGTEFALGVPTNIEGDKFVKKLANHPHFEAVVETKTCDDGATATGPAPLPDGSPAEPIAAKRGPGRPKKA